MNVLRQKGDFNFEESVYVEAAVEQAIDEVIFFALSSNTNIIEYSCVSEKLKEYDGFSFAVVNHSTNKIISSIEEINGEMSDISIRPYFTGNERYLLMVRNAKSPSFENGTMIDYVSTVAEYTNKYSDNFDLYIYFGDDFSFMGDKTQYEERNASMIQKVGDTLNWAFIFILIAFTAFIILFCLVGKKEFGGKQYLNSLDRLPNDLLILMYCIIIGCTFSIYRNSLYMLIKTTFHETYWLNHTTEFYIIRANFCLVALSLTLMMLFFTLKRQIKNKSLFKNTYVYSVILKLPLFKRQES